MESLLIYGATGKAPRAKAFLRRFAGRNDWVVVDTETTGPDPHSDEVVEISVLSAEGDVLVDRLVKPGCEINEQATEVHGIGPDDVEDAPPIDTLTEVLWLFRHHPVLIYNVDFDLPIIRRSYGLRGTILDEDDVDARCVMKAYAMAEGEWSPKHESFSWVKLEEAAEAEGVSTDGVRLHRAGGDAEITRRLVKSFATEE